MTKFLTDWSKRVRLLRRSVFRRVLLGSHDRRDVDKSRDELLDELYYLRDIAGENAQQIVALRAKLAASNDAATADPDPVEAVESPSAPAMAQDPADGADDRDATPRLFVDVSEIALKEGKTGIQRVAREILRALLVNPPAGYRVEAVRAAPGQRWCYARNFARGLDGGTDVPAADVAIRVQQGDVFLGLDHSMEAIAGHRAALEAMRQQGVHVWFVYNDSLPLSRPEWFPPEVHAAFKHWLETLVQVADGIACISRASEDELKAWLRKLHSARQQPPRTGHFQLGADIPMRAPQAAAAPAQVLELEILRTIPSFLTVGTLEPRKGYAQALEAFELLWSQNENVAWVIVGMPGWMTDVVQRRIRHHDEFGKRLFWFMGAGDALLEQLYTTCTALLAPSEGEGFGLPLVEAARHGLPILCRDLPVFREVAGDHASYFNGLDPEALAQAIQAWLGAKRAGTAPTTRDMRWITWDESARQLMDLVLGDNTSE